MSVLSPPEPPRREELEALIREVRARQRRRWLRAAAVISALVGAALAGYSIAGGSGVDGKREGTRAPRPSAALPRSGRRLSLAANHGVLQRFAPRSASTWWAIVESNFRAKVWVVRTTDAGGHWRNVTPPVKLVASSSFVGTKVGWIEADSLHAGAPGAPRSEPVYRTLDGGRSWQRLPGVQTGCQLDFVDRIHGWCVSIDGAAGSEFVRIERTTDGGRSWRFVSRTGVPGQGGSTPGSLPFACDKTIGFTSPRIGWAAEYCAGGTPFLYRSSDAGARWHRLAAVPLPKGIPMRDGGGLTLPAAEGSRRVAVSVTVQSPREPAGRTVIATSGSGGESWQSHLVPGKPDWWGVDLVDLRHWRLSDGSTLLTTNDAGRNWRRLKEPSAVGSAVAPEFLSPRLGFALPDADGNGGLWLTRDGGATWKRITIVAGPFVLEP